VGRVLIADFLSKKKKSPSSFFNLSLNFLLSHKLSLSLSRIFVKFEGEEELEMEMIKRNYLKQHIIG